MYMQLAPSTTKKNLKHGTIYAKPDFNILDLTELEFINKESIERLAKEQNIDIYQNDFYPVFKNDAFFIGASAFNSCKELTEIELYKSYGISSIGADAFKNCSQNLSIVFIDYDKHDVLKYSNFPFGTETSNIYTLNNGIYQSLSNANENAQLEDSSHLIKTTINLGQIDSTDIGIAIDEPIIRHELITNSLEKSNIDLYALKEPIGDVNDVWSLLIDYHSVYNPIKIIDLRDIYPIITKQDVDQALNKFNGCRFDGYDIDEFAKHDLSKYKLVVLLSDKLETIANGAFEYIPNLWKFYFHKNVSQLKRIEDNAFISNWRIYPVDLHIISKVDSISKTAFDIEFNDENYDYYWSEQINLISVYFDSMDLWNVALLSNYPFNSITQNDSMARNLFVTHVNKCSYVCDTLHQNGAISVINESSHNLIMDGSSYANTSINMPANLTVDNLIALNYTFFDVSIPSTVKNFYGFDLSAIKYGQFSDFAEGFETLCVPKLQYLCQNSFSRCYINENIFKSINKCLDIDYEPFWSCTFDMNEFEFPNISSLIPIFLHCSFKKQTYQDALYSISATNAININFNNWDNLSNNIHLYAPNAKTISTLCYQTANAVKFENVEEIGNTSIQLTASSLELPKLKRITTEDYINVDYNCFRYSSINELIVDNDSCKTICSNGQQFRNVLIRYLENDKYSIVAALNNCKSIIDENVIQIEKNAFTSNGINDLIIPNVLSIETAAFSHCTDISNIDISNVKHIGYWAFGNSAISSNVNIHDADIIEDSAFVQSTIKNLTIDNVDNIEQDAFYYANIENICIKNANSIAFNAFNYCTFKHVEINSPTLFSAINGKEYNMIMHYISDLDKRIIIDNIAATPTVVLPSNVYEINSIALDTLFENCIELYNIPKQYDIILKHLNRFKRLTKISLEDGNDDTYVLTNNTLLYKVYSNNSFYYRVIWSSDSIISSDDILEIGSNAIIGNSTQQLSIICNNLSVLNENVINTSVADNNQITSIYIDKLTNNMKSAFSNANSIQLFRAPNYYDGRMCKLFGEKNAVGPISVEINAKDISYLFNNVRNVNYVSAINVEDATNAFDKCYDLKEVFMPDSHTIFRSQFDACTNLTAIHIGEISSLDMRGFANCEQLSSIDIGNVQNIPIGAFQNCYKLADVYSQPLTSIGDASFTNCRLLSNLNLEQNVNIGQYALSGCVSKILDASMIESANAINPYAFAGTKISSYSGKIELSVSTIEKGVFYEAEIMSDNPIEIICPNARIIDDYAFAYSNIDGIDAPVVTYHLGNSAFCSTNISSINIENVDFISDNAFFNCIKLKQVNASNTKCVGEFAFLDCHELTSIVMPKVVTIRKRAFGKCSKLTHIETPYLTNLEYSICDDSGITDLSIINHIGNWQSMNFIQQALNYNDYIIQYGYGVTFDQYDGTMHCSDYSVYNIDNNPDNQLINFHLIGFNENLIIDTFLRNESSKTIPNNFKYGVLNAPKMYKHVVNTNNEEHIIDAVNVTKTYQQNDIIYLS